ncbi:hypothetical protein [Streptomyces sp. MNU89]|nr:hypothetical protein [Streptomyces sp. MNU89]MCC9743096.1 hypothetical protein [Streptomyces sp. MNU89]
MGNPTVLTPRAVLAALPAGSLFIQTVIVPPPAADLEELGPEPPPAHPSS